MNIDPKNLLFFISPLVLVGIAWGTSTAKINELAKENEFIKARVEKVQIMEVEIKYIKDHVKQNSTKLDKILEKME